MHRSWHIGSLTSALFSGLICAVAPAAAEEPGPRRPNWPSSEYHGKIDGNGNPIPCRCLFRGQSYKLGTTVCMNTHKGTVMAECDLVQNNTSWVPTNEPCTISQGPPPWPQTRKVLLAQTGAITP
jgi:hypothetical protein